jgi:GT2 family glycosyltransferase
LAELAILVVSRNTRVDLENCLRSLHNCPPHIPHEIVVIDNASTDGSADAVRAQWPHVRVGARLERRLCANNMGIRRTTSELVLLLNSDTVVPDSAIDSLVQALRELPGASIVGPRLVDGHGHPELSFGRMMGPIGELRQKLLSRLAGPESIDALTSRPLQVDWVSGACLLVRRRDAEAAGLLDERYFMYCEDVDFCAAVRAHGGKVYFTPAANIVHLRGRSGASDPAARTQTYHRSQLAFYQKHHPGWVPFLRLYLGLRGKLPGRTADKEG